MRTTRASRSTSTPSTPSIGDSAPSIAARQWSQWISGTETVVVAMTSSLGAGDAAGGGGGRPARGGLPAAVPRRGERCAGPPGRRTGGTWRTEVPGRRRRAAPAVVGTSCDERNTPDMPRRRARVLLGALAVTGLTLTACSNEPPTAPPPASTAPGSTSAGPVTPTTG